MKPDGLVCLNCGVVWYSAAAEAVAERNGGCLNCGGKLVPRDEGNGAPAADEGADEHSGETLDRS